MTRRERVLARLLPSASALETELLLIMHQVCEGQQVDYYPKYRALWEVYAPDLRYETFVRICLNLESLHYILLSSDENIIWQEPS